MLRLINKWSMSPLLRACLKHSLSCALATDPTLPSYRAIRVIQKSLDPEPPQKKCELNHRIGREPPTSPQTSPRRKREAISSCRGRRCFKPRQKSTRREPKGPSEGLMDPKGLAPPLEIKPYAECSGRTARLHEKRQTWCQQRSPPPLSLSPSVSLSLSLSLSPEEW